MVLSRRLLRIALPGLMLLAGCGPAADTPSGSAVGGQATDFPVRFADIEAIREEMASRSLRQRPTLLNFWATWCEPCVEELPALAAAARDLKGRGLEIIGISLDAWIVGSESEIEARVRATLSRQGVGYPNIIYHGIQRPLLEAFDLPGSLPHSILYDRDGQVVATWGGPVVIDDLYREIERLSRSDGRNDAGG